MKYKLVDGEKVRTVRCAIASATEIAAGDLVAISSGLIVKATNTSAAVAWTPQGSKNGDTVIEVSVGNDFTLVGEMDVVFAVAYKGVAYDINNTTQTIDQGGTTYKVVKVDMSEDAGTVGTATGVRCRINAPIF